MSHGLRKTRRELIDPSVLVKGKKAKKSFQGGSASRGRE